jgi:acetyl esterase/lipase
VLFTAIHPSAPVIAETVSPLGVPIPAPAEERNAIKLKGRVVNSAPEAWERLDSGLPLGASEGSVAKFRGPERWVRNVSEPTLSPFLPDPSKSSGAAVIVLPGGGFMQLAIDREGYSVARWLNERGIAAFVLKYRLAPMPADPGAFFKAIVPVFVRAQEAASRSPAGSTAIDILPQLNSAMLTAREDGLEAMRYVRTHASQWGISPNRIGIMGFSAGAITAIGVAVQADASSRPDLVAPIYGLLPDATTIPASAPPAFIAVAADDAVASVSSIAAYNAWHSAGARAELHVFVDGGHGFGILQQGKSSDQWPQLFDHWLHVQGFEISKVR